MNASAGCYRWRARGAAESSEQGGLLHDAQELLFVHFAVPVAIGLIDHLLQLLVGHALAELLGNALQILEGDFAGLVVIEKAKSFEDLVLGIPIKDLMSHHLQELFVSDCPAAVIVHVGDHFLNLLLFGFETQGTHGDFQLLRVNFAGSVGIEKVESLFDLLLLLLGKFFLLLATSVEATEGHRCRKLFKRGEEGNPKLSSVRWLE